MILISASYDNISFSTDFRKMQTRTGFPISRHQGFCTVRPVSNLFLDDINILEVKTAKEPS